MTREDAKKIISSLEEGIDKDVRLGLSTRCVCKIKENRYEIQDFTDGWSTATVTEAVLEDVLCGIIELISLKWR